MLEVARRNGLNPKLLYYWRKQFAPQPGKAITNKEVCLLPVEIKATPEEIPGNTNDLLSEILEIDLPCGSKLRCGSGFNISLLDQALSALKLNNSSPIP